MFFRLKQSGSRRYLQIVENCRENGAVTVRLRARRLGGPLLFACRPGAAAAGVRHLAAGGSSVCSAKRART